MQLLETPQPLVNGDGVRIKAKLSRPSYVYLYWIGSDGKIEQIYPDGTAGEVRTECVEIPDSGSSLPIEGSRGTEVCVLVARETLWDGSADLLKVLQPGEPVPPLNDDVILNDGIRIAARSRSSADRNIREDSRSVGRPKPLIGQSASDFLSNWRAKLPHNSVRCITWPFHTKGQSIGDRILDEFDTKSRKRQPARKSGHQYQQN